MGVVWATKGDVGVADDEAIESIRVASSTLRVLDKQLIESWRKSGSYAKDSLRKLHEKIMLIDKSGPILFEALCFYATLAGFGNIQSDTVKQQEKCLLELTQFANPDCLGETLATSLPAFAVSNQSRKINSY